MAVAYSASAAARAGATEDGADDDDDDDDAYDWSLYRAGRRLGPQLVSGQLKLDQMALADVELAERAISYFVQASLDPQRKPVADSVSRSLGGACRVRADAEAINAAAAPVVVIAEKAAETTNAADEPGLSQVVAQSGAARDKGEPVVTVAHTAHEVAQFGAALYPRDDGEPVCTHDDDDDDEAWDRVSRRPQAGDDKLLWSKWRSEMTHYANCDLGEHNKSEICEMLVAEFGAEFWQTVKAEWSSLRMAPKVDARGAAKWGGELDELYDMPATDQDLVDKLAKLQAEEPTRVCKAAKQWCQTYFLRHGSHKGLDETKLGLNLVVPPPGSTLELEIGLCLWKEFWYEIYAASCASLRTVWLHMCQA